MKKKMTAAICALAMLALTACGASVTEITLPESIELAPGESQQVEITYIYDKEGLDEQARQKAVDAAAISWSVEGSAVSVSSDGKVESLESGEATVTATTKQGQTASCTVTVTQPIEGINLPESIELAVGGEDSITLTPTLTPDDAQGVHMDHQGVHDHQVRPLRGNPRKDLEAVLSAEGHIVALFPQRILTNRSEIGRIVAEQNLFAQIQRNSSRLLKVRAVFDLFIF